MGVIFGLDSWSCELNRSTMKGFLALSAFVVLAAAAPRVRQAPPPNNHNNNHNHNHNNQHNAGNIGPLVHNEVVALLAADKTLTQADCESKCDAIFSLLDKNDENVTDRVCHHACDCVLPQHYLRSQ